MGFASDAACRDAGACERVLMPVSNALRAEIAEILNKKNNLKEALQWWKAAVPSSRLVCVHFCS